MNVKVVSLDSKFVLQIEIPYNNKLVLLISKFSLTCTATQINDPNWLCSPVNPGLGEFGSFSHSFNLFEFGIMYQDIIFDGNIRNYQFLIQVLLLSIWLSLMILNLHVTENLFYYFTGQLSCWFCFFIHYKVMKCFRLILMPGTLLPDYCSFKRIYKNWNKMCITILSQRSWNIHQCFSLLLQSQCF